MEDPAAINAVIFTALQHLGLTNLSFANAALLYRSTQVAGKFPAEFGGQCRRF